LGVGLSALILKESTNSIVQQSSNKKADSPNMQGKKGASSSSASKSSMPKVDFKITEDNPEWIMAKQKAAQSNKTGGSKG
jgi:hypothetical protein